MYRIGIGQHACYQGMAHLMIGGNGFLTLTDNAALAGWACYHAVGGLFKFAHTDGTFVASCRENSSLVEQVVEISTGKARSALGQGFQLRTALERFTLGMYLQNGNASTNIRAVQ